MLTNNSSNNRRKEFRILCKWQTMARLVLINNLIKNKRNIRTINDTEEENNEFYNVSYKEYKIFFI